MWKGATQSKETGLRSHKKPRKMVQAALNTQICKTCGGEIPFLQSCKGKCIKDSSENKILQFWWPYKYVVFQAWGCYCNTNRLPRFLSPQKIQMLCVDCSCSYREWGWFSWIHFVWGYCRKHTSKTVFWVCVEQRGNLRRLCYTLTFSAYLVSIARFPHLRCWKRLNEILGGNWGWKGELVKQPFSL